MMKPCLALLAALITMPAFAGTKAVFENQLGMDGQFEIEIADNGDTRVEFSNGEPFDYPNYLLIIGGTSYWVFQTEDKRVVTRAADFEAALKQLAPERPSIREVDLSQHDITVKAAGRRRIKGFVGTVYHIVGKTFFTDPFEVVVSKDSRLTLIGRAMERYMKERPMIEAMRLPDPYDYIHRVYALGTPIAGLADLESIKTADIDPARLALPGKPQTVDEILAELREKTAP